MTKNSKTDDLSFDVLIVGGGLAGATLALMLGQKGIRTAVIERFPLSLQRQRSFDHRTTALAAGTIRILRSIGVWEHVAKTSCPITHIEILDGPRLLSEWPVLLDFKSSDVEGDAFGYIADNMDLRASLFDALSECSFITLFAPTDITSIATDTDQTSVTLNDGRILSAALLVGADGRGSYVRDHFRVPVRGWPYGHTAIICCIHHIGDHKNIAIEHFNAHGPFAVLPMTDDENGLHRSGIVWSMPPAEARKVMAMDDDTFADALSSRMPDRYGEITVHAPRAAYPLTLQHALRYTGPRMVLVADAAHGIHPIAGQGLNLGMRGLADLADLLIPAHQNGQDLGAPDLLEQYERTRRRDTIGMIGTTDILTDLFGLSIPGIPLIRRWGLRAVQAIPPLKRFFIQQAMGAELTTKSYTWDQR